ncbi:hypothetical protein BU15DRAFT_62914 [Melanogaster broomeanus]|nr:hypothetical protein BU15DRAFT_62914 [Melanogaster broomeanus]
MAQETPDSFPSEEPEPAIGGIAEVVPPPYSSSRSNTDPPPWEPLFEDLSSQSLSPSLLHRRPLDPPPDCFSTTSPIRIKSNDFPPFRIPSVGDKLADGFRILYPFNLLDNHGIGQLDWVRFLEDLGVAACLAGKGLNAVGSRASATLHPTRGIFPSGVTGAAYDSQFMRSPLEEVHALIGVWNQSAFERRKLKVTLQIKAGDMMSRIGYELVVESL